MMTIVSKTKISFPNLQRYKLLIEADQRLKLECGVTMSVLSKVATACMRLGN